MSSNLQQDCIMSRRIQASPVGAVMVNRSMPASAVSFTTRANDTHATRILRKPDVKSRTGLSNSTIYAWIKDGRFPAPIALGDRAVGWLESEIDSWIAARIAAGQPHS